MKSLISQDSIYLKTKIGIEQQRSMSHGDSPVSHGLADMTWLCFLSSHHPVGFAFSDLLFPLLSKNYEFKRKATSGEERCRITVTKFSLFKELHYKAWINSHVSTKHSVLLRGNTKYPDDRPGPAA